jgi:hypothetical protein
VAIDPGVKGFGAALFSNGKLAAVRHYQYANQTEMILGIINHSDHWMGNGRKPIVVEGYSFASSGNQVTWLAEFRGVLKYNMVANIQLLYEMPIQTWKKHFPIARELKYKTKKSDLVLLHKELGVDISLDMGGLHNVLDAYMIGAAFIKEQEAGKPCKSSI